MGRVNLNEFRALSLFIVSEELLSRIWNAFANDPDMILHVPGKGFFQLDEDTRQVYHLLTNKSVVEQRTARMYWKTRHLDLSNWSIQSTDGESIIWRSVDGETKETIVKKRSDRTCAVCLTQAVYMERCGRCLSVHYCSKDHQQSDWDRHKKTCK